MHFLIGKMGTESVYKNIAIYTFFAYNKTRRDKNRIPFVRRC